MAAQTQGASTAPIVPNQINYLYQGGILYEIEGTDDYLLQAGIVKQEHLPANRPRCRIAPREDGGVFSCSRLASGRVRAIVSATAIIDRDAAFKRFLGGILADIRLSLVKGESHV